MEKYLIQWNAGYGENAEVVEAKNQEEAETAAHDAWHEEVQSNAEYEATVLTKELTQEWG